MRWPIFLVAVFLVLILDSALIPLLSIRGFGQIAPIAPNPAMVLVVFVSLFATRLGALSGSLLLGVLMDLTLPPEGEAVYVIGPHALGAVVGSYLVLQMRTMVFRQRALTIGVLTAIATMLAGIVAVAILVIRSFYGESVSYAGDLSAAAQLLRHFGIAVYSGLIAIPLGWLLVATLPAWGFQWGHPRRSPNIR